MLMMASISSSFCEAQGLVSVQSLIYHGDPGALAKGRVAESCLQLCLKPHF